MRVLLGLSALAAVVNGQSLSGAFVIPNGNQFGSSSAAVTPGNQALASISIFATSTSGATVAVTPATVIVNGANYGINSGNYVNTNNFALTVPFAVSTVVFAFTTNTYTAQLLYRWSPNYPSAATYTCDPCSAGGSTGQLAYLSTTACSASGPGTSPSPTAGYSCALLVRNYNFQNLVASVQNQAATVNSFAVQVLDRNTNPYPNVSSYSFVITRTASPIIGDPQIYGMQGQDFQVHGIPDEIFNMITYPNLQVNARFVYLSSGACHDNFTACFAHPGTYISEEGIRLGKDKVHVVAGSFKKGLTVSVNGVKVTDKKTSLKLGSVEIVNHRRVSIKTPIMAITISNSDKFLNQETALFDEKLLALGAERKTLLSGESFHSEVPLHGLQGQTWRNVEYASGLEYEGSISDYHVASGNLFGSDFIFNQYKQ